MNDSTIKLDGDLDEQGRAMAADKSAAMPGPSTTGYYDEVMAARAAEAPRCPLVLQR